MTAYESLVLAETSLLYYWPLNDSALPTAAELKDSDAGTYVSSGGGLTLLTAGIPDGDYSARFNNDVTFNRIANLTAPVSITLSTGECTFEIWIFITQLTDISRGGPNPWIFGLDGDQNTPVLSLSSPGRARFQAYDGTNKFAGAGSNLATGQWHHLVGTAKSGDKIELYVDGVSIGTTPLGTFYNTTHPHTMRIAGGSGFFNQTDGYLAHGAIYSAVLIPSRVFLHYDVGSTVHSTYAALLPQM